MGRISLTRAMDYYRVRISSVAESTTRISMTLSHRSSLLVIIGIASLVLSGCATSKPQAFKLSFLPTTPQPVVITLEEPPQMASAHYGPAVSGNASPDLVRRAFATPPRPAEVEGLIVGAEDHFRNGKRLYG